MTYNNDSGSHTHTIPALSGTTSSDNLHQHSLSPSSQNTSLNSVDHNHEIHYNTILVHWDTGGAGVIPVVTGLDATSGTNSFTTDVEDHTHSHSVNSGSVTTSSSGAHTHTFTTSVSHTSGAGLHSHTISIGSGNTANTGGQEARPQNTTVMYCIKY